MAKATPTKTAALNQYEAMFLFGSFAANDLDAAMKLAKSIVERHNGQIIVAKKWDERKLTYEIAKQKRGTYVLVYFRAPGTAVAQIERDVNLSEDVLRVLITTADHLNETEMAAVEPQPIVKEEPRPEYIPGERGDRGDRGDRGGDRGPRTGGFDRGGDRPPRGPRRDDAAPVAAKE